MSDQMTPAELRAAADRTAGGYAWGDHQTEQADNELLESAARRLADVIEYVEQVRILRRATILDLAREETNERESNESA